jgi:WxL interacting protein linking bacterial and host surfaces
MRRGALSRLAWLTAAIIATALATTAAGASAATIGGFGVRPANPDPNVAATRAYFIIHGKRDSRRREAVIVTNSDSKPLVLEVDAVDGLTGQTSGVVYANRGVAVHGAGAWIVPDVRRVTVPPNSAITVGFTARIPKYALRGDHLGGIAFEALQQTKSRGHFSVTVVVRTVVGVEFIVPGHATRHLRIYSVALAPLPGTTVPSAVVTLEDDGHLLCHPQLTVAIKGQNATSRSAQTLGTILPGDRIAYPFRWPGALSQGRYAVTAKATRCGQSAAMRTVAAYSLASTRAASSNPSATTVAPTAPLASTSGGWSWWLYGLVGLGGMLAGGVLVLFAARRRSQSPR